MIIAAAAVWAQLQNMIWAINSLDQLEFEQNIDPNALKSLVGR